MLQHTQEIGKKKEKIKRVRSINMQEAMNKFLFFNPIQAGTQGYLRYCEASLREEVNH